MNMKITTTEIIEAECCSSKLIQVIETKFARGTGEPGDPVRMVTQYWSTDSELLAEVEEQTESKPSILRNFQRALARLNMMRKHLNLDEVDSTFSSLVTELHDEIQPQDT